MVIKYLGHSCFKLISSARTVVLTDPYTGVGYELPQGLQADVVTVSHAHFDHNYTKNIAYGQVVSCLGVSDCKDVRILGIDSYHDQAQGALRGKNIIFKF